MNTKEKLTEIIGNVVVNDKGNCIRDVFHPEFVEKIVDALVSTEAYRSLPKPTEWISVEERLPKNQLARVLVSLKADDFTANIGFNKIDTDRYIDGKWVRWSKRVTHWMPLPDAPKGE